MTAAQVMAVFNASRPVGEQEAAIACFLYGYATAKAWTMSAVELPNLLASITLPTGTPAAFHAPEQR